MDSQIIDFDKLSRVKTIDIALVTSVKFTSSDRRVRKMASSRYCKLNKTLAKLRSISALFGDTAKARRKHSIDLWVSPLILQKLPIWLYKSTDFGFSLLDLFKRLSIKSMSASLFLDFAEIPLKVEATSGSGMWGCEARF